MAHEEDPREKWAPVILVILGTIAYATSMFF
jgi:hypothetical protein